MELNRTQRQGEWKSIADAIDLNFGKVATEVERLNYFTRKNKGYFATVDILTQSVPTANVGEIAYVGTSSPFTIYKWENGWVNTGYEHTDSVELGNYVKTDDFSTAKSNLQEQIDNHRDEIESLKEQIDNHRDEIESLKEENQNITTEIDNIKEAISNSGEEGGEGSKEVTRVEFELVKVESKSTFEAFSKLGMTEKADIDGYEIALAKSTNTAEKTKVKVPVFDVQDMAKNPVGLVDEVFVENMGLMMDDKIDKALEDYTPSDSVIEVVQVTGDSEASVMSQKAVTDIVGNWKGNDYGATITENIETINKALEDSAPDDVPTQGSANTVTSGGVYAALSNVEKKVETNSKNLGLGDGNSYPVFDSLESYDAGTIIQNIDGLLYKLLVDYAGDASEVDETTGVPYSAERWTIKEGIESVEQTVSTIDSRVIDAEGDAEEALNKANQMIEYSGYSEYSVFDESLTYNKGDVVRMDVDGFETLVRLTADYAGSGEPAYEPWNLVLDTERAKTDDNMGYVILRKELSFAEQVTKENTIYEIRYDFDLDDEIVVIPNGCVLKFNGGNLKNGILSNDFKLTGDYSFDNVVCNGVIDVEEIKAEKYRFDDDTEQLYYLLRLKGAKKIVLEKNKEYRIDTRTISDSNNTFAFVEGDKQIAGNGAVIVDSRGNSDLLDEKGYFYFLRFSAKTNISIDGLTFKTEDTTIEKIYEDSSEPETFGECFILFTDCKNYAVKNCKCMNLSVGVTCNNTTVYNIDSIQYPIEIEVDNVGYGLMVNGEGNINADIIAKTHVHRIVYSGGAKNCVYNIKMLGEISITAAGVLLQEYWRLAEDETYIYEQNKDIKIRIDCFGTLVKYIAGDIEWFGPLVSHGYYTSDVHDTIAEKMSAFVMDNIDVTVNYHKPQTYYATSFSSAIVAELDYNVMVRGRIAVNLFEDVHEDDYSIVNHIFVTSGSSGIYNNVDYDLDIDIYSQYARTIGVRTTNLGKNSRVRINSNTNVSGENWIDAVVEGHGLIEVSAPSYILAERTSNAAHIHMLRGYVDKSLYGSAFGCASIRMNEGYVVATTATDTSDESYTTNIKKHNNIIIDITGSTFTMTYYEYFKNYSAKNETYSIILHNKGTSTTKVTPKNFDVIKFPSPFYIDAGGQVMTEVKVIDGVTCFDVVSTVVACGTTTERPTAPYNGFEFYDKTLQRPIWWNGEAGRWINADGYAAGYRSGARRAELTDSLTELDAGLQFYDILLGKFVVWNGDSWEDLNGNEIIDSDNE